MPLIKERLIDFDEDKTQALVDPARIVTHHNWSDRRADGTVVQP
jgi:hypothetical protein